MIENKLFDTVNKLLEKYIGGQIFFTELDKAVKFDADLLEDLIHAAKAKYGNVYTIASGEIALSMHNLGIPIDFIVPGGLRTNPDKIYLDRFKDLIEHKQFVFIDDSYFSGRTAAIVKNTIKRLGGTFKGTYVIYDGSKVKDADVDSLYRYYDHFDILGQPLNCVQK